MQNIEEENILNKFHLIIYLFVCSINYLYFLVSALHYEMPKERDAEPSHEMTSGSSNGYFSSGRHRNRRRRNCQRGHNRNTSSSPSRSITTNKTSTNKNHYRSRSRRKDERKHRSRSERDDRKHRSRSERGDDRKHRSRSHDEKRKHRSDSESSEYNHHLDIKKILQYEDGDGRRKKSDKPTLGDWRIYDALGRGSFGQVFRVYRKKNDEHQDAALKIIKNIKRYRKNGLIEVSDYLIK